MSGGFGMGVTPQQVGQAMSPPDDMHQDPLPLRSDPPRTYVPREVDENVEHSATATGLALGEAMQRLEGQREGQYQVPKSPLALYQMKRAGLSDTEIALLLKSGMPSAARDATAVQVRRPDNILPTMDRFGVEDVVRNMSSAPSPGGWKPSDPRASDRRGGR